MEIQLVAQFLSSVERVQLARVSRQLHHIVDQPFAWKFAPPLLITQPQTSRHPVSGIAARRACIAVQWDLVEPHDGHELEAIRLLQARAITVVTRARAVPRYSVESRERYQRQAYMLTITRTAIMQQLDRFDCVREVSLDNCGTDGTDFRTDCQFVLMLLTTLPHIDQLSVNPGRRALSHFLSLLIPRHFDGKHGPARRLQHLCIKVQAFEQLCDQIRTQLFKLLEQNPALRIVVQCPHAVNDAPNAVHQILSRLHARLQIDTRGTPLSTARRTVQYIQTTFDDLCELWDDVCNICNLFGNIVARVLGAMLALLWFKYSRRPNS